MSPAPSWREEADPQVRDELDELLDVSVRAAQRQLEAAGMFYPFGMALTVPGATSTVTPEVRTGPRQVADAAALVELCWASLTEQRGVARAVAVVTDVGGPDGDAVAVALEHHDGPAVQVFLPYAVQRKVRGKKPAQKVLYGDLQAVPGEARVWPGEADRPTAP